VKSLGTKKEFAVITVITVTLSIEFDCRDFEETNAVTS
jgi:hypothetical protein